MMLCVSISDSYQINGPAVLVEFILADIGESDVNRKESLTNYSEHRPLYD